jgi:hypothetical protein
VALDYHIFYVFMCVDIFYTGVYSETSLAVSYCSTELRFNFHILSNEKILMDLIPFPYRSQPLILERPHRYQ